MKSQHSGGRGFCGNPRTLTEAEKSGEILSHWLSILIKETSGYFNILLLFENRMIIKEQTTVW